MVIQRELNFIFVVKCNHKTLYYSKDDDVGSEEGCDGIISAMVTRYHLYLFILYSIRTTTFCYKECCGGHNLSAIGIYCHCSDSGSLNGLTVLSSDLGSG